MNLDYIIIIGFDANTKTRIEKDLDKSDHTGSKSNYIITLCNEALNASENKQIAKTE
jgi:hypothetical protein